MTCMEMEITVGQGEVKRSEIGKGVPKIKPEVTLGTESATVEVLKCENVAVERRLDM